MDKTNIIGKNVVNKATAVNDYSYQHIRVHCYSLIDFNANA